MAQDDLKQATISSLRWVGLTRGGGQFVALAATVALARLVSPAEFGRAAVALILVPLAGILTFEGFASALVQRPSIEEIDRCAAMLMSIVGGTALSVFVFVLRWPVWQPLFGAETADLIALISPVLLVAALGAVSRATLWRRLDYRRASLIDMVSVAAGSVVAVGLAAAGLGARAIVIGGMAQVGSSTLMLLAAAPAPRPRWAWREQREIRRFGVHAALAGLLEVMVRNVDYAILAARLSATATGIYYRAFNLGVVYQDKLSGIMVQVAFPVYSRMPDRNELRRLHERAARVHAAVIFPLLALLIVLAPVLVPFVFGSAWKPSVRPTQILAIAGMTAAILTGYGQVMLAVGRPRQLMHFQLVRLAVYASAVIVASSYGLVAVAVAVDAVYVTVLVTAYHFLLRPAIGVSVRRLIPELGPAVAGCVALAAVTEPLRRLLESAAPPVLTIGAVGIAGLTVYALVLRAAFPDVWNDVYLLVVRVLPPLARLGRRRRAASPITEAQASATTTPLATGAVPPAPATPAFAALGGPAPVPDAPASAASAPMR